MCFSIRYLHPELTQLSGVLFFLLIVCAGHSAYQTRQRTKTLEEGDGGNFLWQAFGCAMFVVAFFLALVVGDTNYWMNLQPYYDVLNLQAYENVDPSKYWGQQLMDAGRIGFAEGTGIDLSRSMGFRNDDWYCVAPIATQQQLLQNKAGAEVPDQHQPQEVVTTSSTFDFWAVGTNCCSGSSTTEFRCGEYNSPTARSGLRLMHDDQRPFFRLAVRQAEAAFGIKSVHPLFFYWMEDPLLEMNAYRDEGYRWFIIAVFIFFLLNLLCTFSAVVVFSKMG